MPGGGDAGGEREEPADARVVGAKPEDAARGPEARHEADDGRDRGEERGRRAGARRGPAGSTR